MYLHYPCANENPFLTSTLLINTPLILRRSWSMESLPLQMNFQLVQLVLPHIEIFFFVSQVQMWELDHIKGRALKNWCFWIVVLEKTLEGLLDCKEIRLVNPKGNQPWIFVGRTDSKAEAPILWPPDAKSQVIGKYPDAGKNWRQKKRGAEDEMIR